MSDLIFIDNTDEIIEKLEREIPIALEEIVREMEHLVREKYVPVDTGRLKNSFRHKVKGDTAEVYTNVEYAPYVEFGTSKNSEKQKQNMHFLKRAGDNHRLAYTDILLKHLRRL